MSRFDKLSTRVYFYCVKNIDIIFSTYGLSLFILAVYLLFSYAFKNLFSASDMVTMIASDVFVILLAYLIYKKRTMKPEYKSMLIKGFEFNIVKVISLILISVPFTYMSITASLYINKLTSDGSTAVTSYPMWTMIVGGIIIAPIAEEVLYRLCIYNILRVSSHWFVAMLMSSLMFGVFHGTAHHMIMGTLFSMFLVMSYEFTGQNIIVPICMHMIYNTATTFMTEDMFFYEDGLVPIISIIAIVFILVIFSAILFRKQAKRASSEE